jgi:hypothetical protein
MPAIASSRVARVRLAHISKRLSGPASLSSSKYLASDLGDVSRTFEINHAEEAGRGDEIQTGRCKTQTAPIFRPAPFATNTFSAYFARGFSICACAAARRAIGTRNGEHET